MAYSKDPSGGKREPGGILIENVDGGTHGSHWGALFPEQDDVMQWIQGTVAPDNLVLKRSTDFSTQGETEVSLYKKELVQGLNSLTFVADIEGSSTIATGFPFVEGSGTCKSSILRVMVWPLLIEAQIESIIGQAGLLFFPVDYFLRMEEYRAGKIEEVAVGLVAYALRRNPPDEEKTVEVDGKKVDMSKTQIILPLSNYEEWAYPDDYYVQGPVESMEEVEFGDEKGLMMKIGMEPLGGLDIFVNRKNLEGEPATGDMITTYGWLTGKAKDTDWDETG